MQEVKLQYFESFLHLDIILTKLALYYYSRIDRFIMFITLFSNPYVLNRECEANNVINSLNCDGFDKGSRCSLNLPDLR